VSILSISSRPKRYIRDQTSSFYNIIQQHHPTASSNSIIQQHHPTASSNSIIQQHHPIASAKDYRSGGTETTTRIPSPEPHSHKIKTTRAQLRLFHSSKYILLEEVGLQTQET
jgi:hypothetical protein